MTEKDYNPEQRNAKAMSKQVKVTKNIVNAPINTEKPEIKIDKKTETSMEIIKDIEKSGVSKEIAEKEEKLDEKAQKVDEKSEDKKEEPSKSEKKPEKKKPKKTEAVVNGSSLKISTKDAKFICKFIKNKSIDKAIKNLEMVIAKKMAVPMKGEIPHRKGNLMSGRYPKNASEIFINLLKTLSANSNVSSIDNPIIVEAIANIASRPYGRFGRVRRKRTHVKIVVKQKNILKKKVENKEAKENGKIKDSSKVVLNQEVKNI